MTGGSSGMTPAQFDDIQRDHVGDGPVEALAAELARQNAALFLRLSCVGYHNPPVPGIAMVHYPEGFDGLPGEFWCAFCGVEHPIPADLPPERVIWRLAVEGVPGGG